MPYREPVDGIDVPSCYRGDVELLSTVPYRRKRNRGAMVGLSGPSVRAGPKGEEGGLGRDGEWAAARTSLLFQEKKTEGERGKSEREKERRKEGRFAKIFREKKYFVFEILSQHIPTNLIGGFYLK